MGKVTELKYSSDENFIIINVPYAEAYIPYDLVGDPSKGNPVAYNFGDGLCTIGLFNMRFYKDENSDRNSSPLRTFTYPDVIVTKPSDREVVTLKLDKDMYEEKYLVLKYYEGDIMMASHSQAKSQNCEAFMNQMIQGKLPKGLSYTDLYFSWDKNFDINEVDPGVSAITMQMIVSENCRVKGDPQKQFRKIVNNPGVTLYDYDVNNMVEVCANSSVLNALIFERFGDMLTSSINMTKEGVKQNTTPLEEVLYV